MPAHLNPPGRYSSPAIAHHADTIIFKWLMLFLNTNGVFFPCYFNLLIKAIVLIDHSVAELCFILQCKSESYIYGSGLLLETSRI